MYNNRVEFNILQGLVLEGILNDSDEVLYFVTNGGIFKMYHEGDCCESVTLEDVVGDPRDLKGALIVTAEVALSSEEEGHASYESCTWSFYKIATPQGDLTIRWFGTSNGYYSETVDIVRHEGAIPKSAVEFVGSK